MDEDFLLQNETAKRLYHEAAQKMPILDYHNHLEPQVIYEDRCYSDIAEVWLGRDHYKWRAMRADGVNEEKITGKASNREKFNAWCATMPDLIGNPLYHWTHLELKRYFGIDALICPENANAIWPTDSGAASDTGVFNSQSAAEDECENPLHNRRSAG